MCIACQRDGPVKAAERRWRQRWWRRCVEVKAFPPGKKEQHVPPAINPRYYPRYVSDMLLATPATRDSFCHYIRGVTPTRRPRLHLLRRV